MKIFYYIWIGINVAFVGLFAYAYFVESNPFGDDLLGVLIPVFWIGLNLLMASLWGIFKLSKK